MHFLLQDKKKSTYKRMLRCMKGLMPSLNPCFMLVDFERAMIRAASAIYPQTRASGCYFHLRQAIMKRVGKEGLTSAYSHDKKFLLFVTKMSCLAYVPQNDVSGLWDQLKLETDHNCPKQQSLVKYFQKNYVGSREKLATFPVSLWNKRGATIGGVARTTNCCESFHNRMRRFFDGSHPSIETFIVGLNDTINTERLGRIKEKKVGSVPRLSIEDELLSASVQGYDDHGDKMEFLNQIARLVLDRKKGKKRRK